MEIFAGLDPTSRDELRRSADILYSHHLTLHRIPMRRDALAVWMDRLVEFEVRVFALLPTGQLNNIQDRIIAIADIGHLSEVDLDARFLSFGVQRATIRLFIGPYAGPDWPTRFPRYATHLQSELEEYHRVVRASDIQHNCLGVNPTSDARRLALDSARNGLIARRNEGRLDEDSLIRCLFRISLDHTATFDLPMAAYQPPSMNNACYRFRAPFQCPGHRDVVDMSSDDESPNPRRSTCRRAGEGTSSLVPRGRRHGHSRGRARARGRGSSRARST